MHDGVAIYCVRVSYSRLPRRDPDDMAQKNLSMRRCDEMAAVFVQEDGYFVNGRWKGGMRTSAQVHKTWQHRQFAIHDRVVSRGWHVEQLYP